MNHEFWNGKRVLLTGHTGFKGAWLALWLQRLGARVTGFALPAEGPSLFEEAGVEGALASRLGDLADLAAVGAAVEAADPEIVLHLAAQSLVKEGYARPLATWATNVMGTAHLLETLRGRPALRVVVSVTSDKCYANREWPWGYRESDPLGGKDPYSASKAGAELVTACWRDAFLAAPSEPRPAAVATARSGNVIGGGDWAADRLVPDLVRGFGAGRPVAIRSPDATRPWQHVLEPLAGYLMLAESLWDDPSLAGPWNFGPGEEGDRPVRWIADRVVELWGDGAGWRLDDEVHPPEANWLKLDASKARRQLGWRPRLGLEAGLEWTVEWYRAHARGDDMGRLTRDQIDAYAALGEPG
ncbi:MAG: CDP-glucose 4,6-dehydratase [Thermoanaerobaculia bacterium]|nr:CDP-glucose 4,6-dehydratase [Thermoanaerobaculia bacterium]